MNTIQEATAASDAPKICFVTVGATASFSALVRAVLSSTFLAALKQHSYTELQIQYGNGGDPYFNMLLKAIQTGKKDEGIKITGFDIDQAGLQKYMIQARGGTDTRDGVVICHAGSGTILEALRISAPLIVVPNEALLDNHQAELADALSEQGYVVRGHLNTLSKALADSEDLRKQHQTWPPVNSGVHRQAKGLAGVMDEEMGFLD